MKEIKEMKKGIEVQKYKTNPLLQESEPAHTLKSHSQVTGYSETLKKYVLFCKKVKLSVCTR
jgi:hypothetical protein